MRPYIAVICVYDEAGNVIETHEHTGAQRTTFRRRDVVSTKHCALKLSIAYKRSEPHANFCKAKANRSGVLPDENLSIQQTLEGDPYETRSRIDLFGRILRGHSFG